MKSVCKADFQREEQTTAPSSGAITDANSKTTTSSVTCVCSMYIHGGRDLKEGPISTLWRVNLTLIQQLHENPQTKVGWEQIMTTGKDIGKISHHTCAMITPKEILFSGGLKGDSSSQSVFTLNLLTNVWSNVKVNVSYLFQLFCLFCVDYHREPW